MRNEETKISNWVFVFLLRKAERISSFFPPLVKVYSFKFNRHGLLWELKEGVDMGMD